MNATAAAVTLIIVTSLILAVMAGIAGFTLGRARATDDTAKAAKSGESIELALDDLKSGVLYQFNLLIFTLDQAFEYRKIASRAIAEMPADHHKVDLERELQEIDAKMSEKVTEIEDYVSEEG